MNKALSLLTVSIFIVSSAASFAETTSTAPVAGATTAAVALAAATPTAATSAATTATPAITAPLNPVKAELKDGTKILFESDASVSVIGKDGSKTPAPDGILTLKDGTTFAVKEGKRVAE